ncbi:hypothetical protein MOC16_gp100 [Klebsiella phage vB_KpM_FBKp24]|uniref:Uncharacterized protein n=1 Tax=Klebsiella phage vB_KpM_FBKp24 TaxID=2801834 RepID=A0A7U0GBB3_9CAUD|nr:hypothetical protein MOC16_gp100 [Klebsiella phage vB_KpM_FBKp24]QQV92030.1 hypothetical protein vBKpMFBKp24_313 [Klebsiella phage vB_KpM_FBKp24]
MNYYYIDSSATVNGVGTKGNPFNSIQSAIDANLTHPLTLYLKAGQTYELAYYNRTTASFFNNKTGVQSVITRYGTGAKPILTSNNDTIIIDAYACQIKFENIRISPKPGSERTAIYLNLIPIGDSANNNICNLTLNKVDFIGTPESIGGMNGINRVFCLNSLVDYAGLSNIAHKLLISNCTFDNVNAGVQLRGNPDLSDKTTYHGDQKKSYGFRVINCSFTNIINSAVFIGWAASKNQSRDVIGDDMATGVDGLYYSSYRYNVYNTSTGASQADVPVWFSGTRYLTLQNFEIHGAGPAYPDRQTIDFDYHCHYCVARYGYTSNNARGSMIIQGPFSNSWYSSKGYTPLSNDAYTLYYTLGFGSIGNVIEYVISFNDGVGRTTSTADKYWQKTSAFRYVYDNVVRNCVFIDTVTTANDNVIAINPQTDDSLTALSLTLDSNIFYYANKTATELVTPASMTNFPTMMSKFKLKNNIFFSEKWAGATPTSTGLIEEGNLFTNPAFLQGLSNSSFAGLKEALLAIKLKMTSPCIGSGSSNNNPDFIGKVGNNIGSIQ